jgi:hypothetical protein
MKLYNFAVPIVVLTVAGVVYSVRSQITPKPLRSFIVTSVMSSPKKDSPYLHTYTLARAVREDGSWVEIWTRIINNRETHERKIHDYIAGTFYGVVEETKSIIKDKIPENEYRHRMSAATSCEGHPSGKLLGFDVNYSEDVQQMKDNPQGAATVVVKDWLAPDLGCFVLQKETISTRNNDGVQLVDTKITPIDIKFVSVDQFFEVPTTGYTERTREEVRALLEQTIAQVPQPTP